MHPYKALRTGLPAIPDHLVRRFIALIVVTPEQQFRHVFSNQYEQLNTKPVDPVRYRLAGKRYAAPDEIRLHPV